MNSYLELLPIYLVSTLRVPTPEARIKIFESMYHFNYNCDDCKRKL